MSHTEIDLCYETEDSLELGALVYRPTADHSASLPLVIDIHGGAWSSGHRKSGRHYDRLLAEAGICVVSIDFRHGPDFQHPAAIVDILAAVSWATSSDELAITPTSVGLVGSSSGGHLALYSALDPDRIDRETAARIDHVIALWPVSNPLARYQYATARLNEDPAGFVNFDPARLKAGHDGYFRNQQQMHDAAIQHILVSGKHGPLPPAFIVQPELDQNVPVMMSQTLAGAWELAGGDVAYRLYPGVAHGFAHAEGPQTEACIADMVAWIEAHSPGKSA